MHADRLHGDLGPVEHGRGDVWRHELVPRREHVERRALRERSLLVGDGASQRVLESAVIVRDARRTVDVETTVRIAAVAARRPGEAREAAELGDVVRVAVGDEHRRDLVRVVAGLGETMHRTAAAVDDDDLAVDVDEHRGPAAVRGTRELRDLLAAL